MNIQVRGTDDVVRALQRSPKPRLVGRPEVSGSAMHAVRPGGNGDRLAAVAAGGGPRKRPKRDPLRVLVERITQGFTQDEYERARALGYENYLEEQLDHLSIDDSALDARLAGFTTLSMSPKQIYDGFPLDITRPYYEVKAAAVLRSVFSKRQLFERMVEFWTDHFNVDQNKGDVEYLFKPEEDRLVLRQNALGSFPALLTADAHNAAMLFYLDNWLNLAGAIQENYARELMELHTMGVGGGYTEDDIREVAKCFTGWTLNNNLTSPNYLRAKFESIYHQGGSKTVLGVAIPSAPGSQNAQRVLDILVAHPSTAQFLARKLIKRFLNEDPPQALVDQVAQVFQDTNGDIKALLRTILARENLTWNSPNLGLKFRRPFHVMTSLLRGLDADIGPALEDVFYPLAYLAFMAHSPFDWSPPTGYPDTVDIWGSSLLPRWRFINDLMQGLVLGVALPGAQIQERLEISSHGIQGLSRRINRRILGETLSEQEETLVQQFIDARGTPITVIKIYEAIALAASMPGNQWY